VTELIGAIHMHSVFSDGSGEVEDIARYAGEAGLDYILLTDHNTLRALKEGYEGWYDNTLLLVGCEINDKLNENHYLAFGINEAYSTRLPAKEYVKRVKDAGGIGFLAHPHEKRKHMVEHPPYPWTDWDISDFTGIEVWNHMSEWMENLTEQNKYKSFLHPLKSIVAPPKQTLAIWDKFNLTRKVIGIGGVDAHAHKYNVLGFVEVEVFPYKVLFKSIRTHLLIEDELPRKNNEKSLNTTKKIIYDALASGNSFFSNDYISDSKGFRFYAEAGKKKYQMGETVDYDGKIKLSVFVPSPKSEIKLIRNGKLIETEEGGGAKFDIKVPGVYRVEVLHNKKAWIFSNHIRINI
jgi:PHP domain